jgi:hypothetical protein
VTFQGGSRLERIDREAFSSCGLKSIVIPSSVVVVGKHSFFLCKPLTSVAFESGSRLELIDECAFSKTGLKSIVIPSSVIVLGKWSFDGCKPLETVTFERGARLERIEESAFRDSGLKSIVIPSSVVIVGKESFYECKSLESVRFESGSRLERMHESAFSGTLVDYRSVCDSLPAFRSERAGNSCERYLFWTGESSVPFQDWGTRVYVLTIDAIFGAMSAHCLRQRPWLKARCGLLPSFWGFEAELTYAAGLRHQSSPVSLFCRCHHSRIVSSIARCFLFFRMWSGLWIRNLHAGITANEFLENHREERAFL